MRLIKQKTLVEQARLYPAAAPSLSNFASAVKTAKWESMHDIVRSMAGSPSPVGRDRVVFNIAGNSFRLICAVDFRFGVVYVKWFGNHAAYDKVDAATAVLAEL